MKYICKNYGSCTQADERTPIELAIGADPTHDCGFKLELIEPEGDVPPLRKYALIAAALAVIFVVVGVTVRSCNQPIAPVEPPVEPPVVTPPGVTPPGVTPPGATPPGVTPPGATPPGATPPGATPPGATPPGATPPGATPPGHDADKGKKPGKKRKVDASQTGRDDGSKSTLRSEPSARSAESPRETERDCMPGTAGCDRMSVETIKK
jgi:hypothetical protein